MVVVIEDHRAPVVTQMVWYRVGSADDPAGQAGTAHFLEHLMFKATDKLADGEFSRVVADNGGAENAFTSVDQTAYFERIAADRLDLVMGMEADRMVNLSPAAASVLSEREVVREERGQVVESDPGGVLREKLMAALYPNSPEGRPAIGTDREIAGLTQAGEMAFYRAHYAPNNAILVVAGDVYADEVHRMAERHFGAIPALAQIALRPRTQEPPRDAAGRLVMHDPRVTEPQFTRLYLAPPRRTGDQKGAAALVVLADLLDGDRVTSVMNRDLVQGDGIALAADAFYVETGLNLQTFGFSVVPKPGTRLGAAEPALDALIAGFVAQGPDPAEVERIKGRRRGAEIFGLDNVPGRANRIGDALTSGLTLEDVEEWPDILQSVTAADVQEAARAVLRIENSVTGWALPPGVELQGVQP
jgi:zinc protease